MTYAIIPPLGVNVSKTVNTTINTVNSTQQRIASVQNTIQDFNNTTGSNIPSGLPLPSPNDTVNQILASSPDATQIAEDWGPSIGAASQFAVSFDTMQKDPGQAFQFMMGALPVVMDAAGISGTANDIASVAAGFAPQVGELIDGHPGPLVQAAIKTGAAYGCKALGIPPEVGSMTSQAIDDVIENGEITSGTLTSIGGMGGSIGGAALCSLLGIPPCIGGYIGGYVGKLAGAAIASVLGIGGGKAARRAAQILWGQTVATFRGELNTVRQQYVTLALAERGSWWANFDHAIDSLSLQWTALECVSAFARFPLLWSGRGAVNPFFLYPYSASLCARPINQNLSRGTGCLNSQGLLANVTESGCGEAYGCEYPTFPTLGADDQYSERVVQAFAAYDIWWVPSGGRTAIDNQWAALLGQPWSLPNDPTVRSHQKGKNWEDWMATMQLAEKNCKSQRCKNNQISELTHTLENYKTDLNGTLADALSPVGIQAAMSRIAGDITATAGAYAAAAAINAQKSKLIAGDLSNAIAQAKQDSDLIIQQNQLLMEGIQSGKRWNSAINYSMLALGGGLLGASLLKGRRR